MTVNLTVILAYLILALASLRGWGFTAGKKRVYRKVSKRPLISVVVSFVVIFMMPTFAFTPNAIHYTYLFFCFAYMLTTMLSFDGNKLTSVACLFMAAYSLIFGIDSWVNSDAETWIYNNHEIIVLLLHSFIILSFSSRFTTRLASFINYCLGYRSDDSNNTFNTFDVQSRSNQTEATR